MQGRLCATGDLSQPHKIPAAWDGERHQGRESKPKDSCARKFPLRPCVRHHFLRFNEQTLVEHVSSARQCSGWGESHDERTWTGLCPHGAYLLEEDTRVIRDHPSKLARSPSLSKIRPGSSEPSFWQCLRDGPSPHPTEASLAKLPAKLVCGESPHLDTYPPLTLTPNRVPLRSFHSLTCSLAMGLHLAPLCTEWG